MSRRGASRRGAAALAAVALALTVTVAACGSESSDGASGTESTTTAADASDASAGPTTCAPVADLPAGSEDKPTSVDAPSKPTTGKVKVTVLEEGDGPEVTDASYVTVDYLGVSCASGKQFDASWDRGEPITIAMPSVPPTATAFSVIPGWNEGLLGQKQGALVQLDIPSELAYGEAGRPPDIAPNDPLTFVVRVNQVSDTAPAG